MHPLALSITFTAGALLVIWSTLRNSREIAREEAKKAVDALREELRQEVPPC
jgi:hypothetical protein